LTAQDIDPFELPPWLGIGLVTWEPTERLSSGHLVSGMLVGDDDRLGCDLLAVDEAAPRPVTDDRTRTRAHHAWRDGQVLLVAMTDRLTLAVPGTRFTADRVLIALARLARAVGAHPSNYAALIRVGAAVDGDG
jgi:hypothetical protein